MVINNLWKHENTQGINMGGCTGPCRFLTCYNEEHTFSLLWKILEHLLKEPHRTSGLAYNQETTAFQ